MLDLRPRGSGFESRPWLPTSTQRAIPSGSVNEYQRKLHGALAGFRLRATGNGDQRRPMGLKARGRTVLLCYFYLCDTEHSAVFVIPAVSVRPSVRFQYCAETSEPSTMGFSLYGSPQGTDSSV